MQDDEKDEATEDTQPEPETTPEPKRTPKSKLPVFTSEQIASRERAHAIKVEKFLAGGEF